MKAPTNIYGPGRELVKKGEDVPAEWFDLLPDLQAHLDNVEHAPDPAGDAAPAKSASVAPQKVKATATVGRTRRSS